MKGKAGSPYAIRDYYDVDPDLAEHVDKRMEEFEELVKRTHECGLKMIIDFVPNHVARQYHSIAKPQGVKDLGENDDCTQAFNPQNNFYYIPGQKLEGEIDFYNPEMGTYEEMPAKATGNDRFDPWPNRNDWYETVKLNYGVDYINHTGGHFDPIPDTWYKMEQILSYWAEKESTVSAVIWQRWYPANSGDGSSRASKLLTRILSLLPRYIIRTNTGTISTMDTLITCTTKWAFMTR